MRLTELTADLQTIRQNLASELEAINLKDGGKHNPRAKSWMEKVKEFFAQ